MLELEIAGGRLADDVVVKREFRVHALEVEAAVSYTHLDVYKRQTQSRADRPDVGRRFIAVAAESLKPGGRLYLVANRHLPYEACLLYTSRCV